MSLLPKTIDEVLAQLDQIILRARTERSRLGSAEQLPPQAENPGRWSRHARLAHW